MADDPIRRKLLHDIQSKSASLNSAGHMLKDCPPAQAAEMIRLMAQEARDILQCLLELKKEMAP